jgi:hypothetical protein
MKKISVILLFKVRLPLLVLILIVKLNIIKIIINETSIFFNNGSNHHKICQAMPKIQREMEVAIQGDLNHHLS